MKRKREDRGGGGTKRLRGMYSERMDGMRGAGKRARKSVSKE